MWAVFVSVLRKRMSSKEWREVSARNGLEVRALKWIQLLTPDAAWQGDFVGKKAEVVLVVVSWSGEVENRSCISGCVARMKLA